MEKEWRPVRAVAHLLPEGHTVLVAEREPRRLARPDHAVREGVVAQHGLGVRAQVHCTSEVKPKSVQ